MFNSTLLTDYPALTPSIKNRQMEIVEFPYDLWQDCGDQVLDGSFTYYFPPGFIDRDKERAKQVIRELYEAIADINGLMEQRHAAKHNGDMCFIVDTTQDFNFAESTVGRGCDLIKQEHDTLERFYLAL